jgi:Cdc6-like AAA superfamily ATPase
LDWIAPPTYVGHHGYSYGKRQPGTGEWFLNSPKFLAWVRGDIQTLFCEGIPGAGKTVLLSIVIEHLRSIQNGGEWPVAFLFCNYGIQEEQIAERLLAALLRQLAEHHSFIPESLRELYEKRTQSYLSLERILDTLSTVTKNLGPVYLVVDAVDECSDNTRREFLKSIGELQNKTKARLLVTSRHIDHIERQLEQQFAGHTRLEIRADAEDIEKYLDGQIVKLHKFVQNDPSLQRNIKERIKTAADGM